MPNKLSYFWLELKRRRVHRLMAIYAGSAYVIFEASTLIFPRWGLPDWTIDLVLYLLILGAIVTFVMGWIYDLTPDGIQKTGSVSETTTKVASPTPNGWKIASYISLVVIVVLLVLNIIPRSGKKEILDKSIAVLPFESQSEDPDKKYQADGVMDAILLHLSKIEDLRVISRTSVEQYRGTDKTVSQICEELDVAYLLEGNFRRYGDQARLIVQLIQPGREEHVWANNYDRDWVDIFTVESEVAQAVAGELQAVITPEVKQRIEKVPTSSLTAYDYYQRGREEQWKYSSRIMKSDPIFLDNAKILYQKALHYDPAFAQAQANLAEVYLEKFLLSGSLAISYLDSARILADRALSFDHLNALAHNLKGNYYYQKGDTEQSSREFEIAIELNPNDPQVYANQANNFFWIDAAKAILYYRKAASLLSGTARARILEQLSYSYFIGGFEEQAEYYGREALRLGADSVGYYNMMVYRENIRGQYMNCVELCDKALSFDPENSLFILTKGMFLGYTGHYEESIITYRKIIENEETYYSESSHFHRIGYAYWQLGEKEKADHYFGQMIAFCDSLINLGISTAQLAFAYYDLAGTYAFLGKTEEALINLRKYEEVSSEINESFVYWIREGDPLFGTVRDEPEFQEILAGIETRSQKEHDRRRQWLEENEML